MEATAGSVHGPLEADAAVGQFVDTRRGSQVAAVASQLIGADRVRHDPQHARGPIAVRRLGRF
jgi:hypothetical protein